MNRREDGGPAFPRTVEQLGRPQVGMSLRDYFAASALAVIPGDSENPDALATDAYRIADAMLKARQ